MKKFITLLVLCISLISIAETATAHAIWIESNSKAVKNQGHEVKIFYGEYPSGELEPTAKWFSDLKDLEVWVLSPSQKRTKLVLTDATDHLKGSFVPQEDGVYYISTAHSTRELGGKTKYEFSSVLPVTLGKATTAASLPKQALAVISQPGVYTADQQIELQVLRGGEVFQGVEVMIMSPEGWVKTIKTNEKGLVTFTPLQKGNYVIEASDYKEEAGEWNSKAYTHSWKGSTTHLVVK